MNEMEEETSVFVSVSAPGARPPTTEVGFSSGRSEAILSECSGFAVCSIVLVPVPDNSLSLPPFVLRSLSID
jgi:hypothetical protein